MMQTTSRRWSVITAWLACFVQQPDQMLSNWPTLFPNCEPIAHLLRTQFPARWVRFHSLPESKRYATSALEYDIVLSRHNAVLNELASPGAHLVLLTTEFSEHALPGSAPGESPQAAYWRTVAYEDAFWHIYGLETVWRPGAFDSFIRRAADDEMNNVMICEKACRWIFHPYDGGMDVVLDSPDVRDALRKQFSAWLSTHPAGL